jgi:cytosine/adenosine deaminase-related metal-dependent hydrolase
MVRVMHLAASGHKEARLDASLISPEDAVGMATVNNARAVLWGDQIGSIEAGRRADLILFDLVRPEWAPWNEKNIVSNLVYSASGDSVDTVILDGKTVVEGGNLKTVDERRVIEDAQRHSKRFVELANQWEAARSRA